MQKFLTLTVFCFCSVFLINTESSEAADIPFAVDDYIPVLFKDTELRLGGSLQFSGSARSFDNDSAGGSSVLSQSSSSDNDSYNFFSNLNFRKRYITVSEWYTFNSSFNSSFFKETNSSKSEVVFSTTFSQMSERENTNKSISPNISSSIDVGKYVSGDFMISSRASLSFNYSEQISGNGVDFFQTTSRPLLSDTATRNTSTSETDVTGDNKRLRFTGEILFGNGRMYNGVYAFTAISMIEELESKKLLLKTPTENEMRELTEIIYQYRLVHVVDFRILKIEALDSIISYLQSKGIVDLDKSMTTLVIADVWDFFPSRSSHNFGLRVRGGIGIELSKSTSQNTQKSIDRNLVETFDINNPSVITTVSDVSFDRRTWFNSKNVETMPYFTVLIDKGHPISNRLQLDLRGQAWYYLSSKDSLETNLFDYVDGALTFSSIRYATFERESFTRFFLLGSLTYSFNSRTTASAIATYDRADFDQTYIESQTFTTSPTVIDTVTANLGGYSFRINGNVTYRISIPTTISARLFYDKRTINIFSNQIGNDSRDSYSISLDINHYLF